MRDMVYCVQSAMTVATLVRLCAMEFITDEHYQKLVDMAVYYITQNKHVDNCRICGLILYELKGRVNPTLLMEAVEEAQQQCVG